MNSIPFLHPDWRPTAAPGAVVHAGNVRFTVLTPRLLRLEFDPDHVFLDRPSQLIWYRDLPVPEFSTSRNNELLEIKTGCLHLCYEASEAGFNSDSLSITLINTGHTWRYGDENPGLLPGTTRTLDEITGKTFLNSGLLSTDGWTVIDDSNSLVFSGEGWIQPRQQSRSSQDLYFFGYDNDFAACLQDFQAAAGPCPLIPRQILGNWWSRYHPYSHPEILELMKRFRHEEIPLAVCVLDMDWHIVDTGNDSRGWTGYTWNRDLFPDPADTLRQLHELGLMVTLNLHPADGVHPHEEAYPAFARRMGLDPQSRIPISFDLADPEFTAAYFELLHHPYEDIGVDFWWLDWQQGSESRLNGLDPLWWLNHLHFYNPRRDAEHPGKRPLILSRWPGLGGHRTPIGFSGDTTVTWQSLAFQPFFTASAANAAFGWWSHDIGGHMGGIEEPELYLRWVQYGVFSPIFRFHSTVNHFNERLPWKYDAETARICKDILQFRHQLIPYLYSMAWRNHTTGQALAQPMYHHYPQDPEAYACPQQYTFGPDIIAAPFTSSADPDTRLSRQVVWLPEGEWYNLFSYEVLSKGWHVIHGELEEVPAFIRAGGILPLDTRKPDYPPEPFPEELIVKVFAGADGEFNLYEDDGETQGYLNGCYAITRMSQQLRQDKIMFQILPAAGKTGLLPEIRAWKISLVGANQPEDVSIKRNDEPIQCKWNYNPENGELHLEAIALAPADKLTCIFVYAHNNELFRPDNRRKTLFKILKNMQIDSWIKEDIYQHADTLFADINYLVKHHNTIQNSLTDSQVRVLFESFCKAGIHFSNLTDEHFVVLWNPEGREDFKLIDKFWRTGKPWFDNPGGLEKYIVPEFSRLSLESSDDRHHRYSVTYGDFFTVTGDFTNL